MTDLDENLRDNLREAARQETSPLTRADRERILSTIANGKADERSVPYGLVFAAAATVAALVYFASPTNRAEHSPVVVTQPPAAVRDHTPTPTPVPQDCSTHEAELKRQPHGWVLSGRLRVDTGEETVGEFSVTEPCKTVFRLERGIVTFDAFNLMNGELLVEMPNSTVRVTGTVFVTEVSPTGERVHVKEGTVSVRIRDRDVTLRESESIEVSTAKPRRTGPRRTVRHGRVEHGDVAVHAIGSGKTKQKETKP